MVKFAYFFFSITCVFCRSNTDDEAIQCALIVLEKLYQKLKREIHGEVIKPESLLKFLTRSDGETVGDVIGRYFEPEKKIIPRSGDD